MKALFMAILVMAAQHVFAQQALLTDYYAIKDALVADDAHAASESAAALQVSLAAFDVATLGKKDQKLVEKLRFDARHISEKQEIDHQREHFAALSANMLALAKAAKLSAEPIYQQYCPMKKSLWLSKEQEIKNPYYGSEMLTCGNVQATLKP